MSWDYTKIHPEFSYNGAVFSKLALIQKAKALSKTGEAHEQAIGDFLTEWLSETKTITLTTSGSTGKPKLLKLEKSHMVNSALATLNYFKLKPGNTVLLCLPVKYIAGKMLLVRAMVGGLELTSVSPSTTPLSDQSKTYDFAAMVPLQAASSLAHLNKIKTLILGGSSVSPSLKMKLQRVTTACYETYGMTETITHIAVRKLNSGSNAREEQPPFKALSNVHLSTDDRNCLVIDAPLIANEQIVTNDIVTLISDSSFYWQGRFDHIINSGGIKIIPEQLESKLALHIQNPFVLCGLPDQVLGEQLILLVEGAVNADALLQGLKTDTTLKNYEVPKEVRSLAAFVYTPNGKIKRKATIALLK